MERTGRNEKREEEERKEEEGGGRGGQEGEGLLDSVAINLHSSTQIMTGLVFSIWIQFIQIIAT